MPKQKNTKEKNKCPICGKKYDLKEGLYKCPVCNKMGCTQCVDITCEKCAEPRDGEL